jgi:hypothetical protein
LRHGNQGASHKVEQEAEVFIEDRPAMPALRPAAKRVPEVPHLPHLPAYAGERRQDPRDEEGKLVT